MITQSIWPLIAAALAPVLIGYIWYHPRVFGTLWMRLSGVSPEMVERGLRRRHIYLALGFLACLVVAYVMRLLLISLSIGSVSLAVRLGFFLWLGFVAGISASAVLWEHRPLSLYLLNAGYWLLALIIMSVILIL